VKEEAGVVAEEKLSSVNAGWMWPTVLVYAGIVLAWVLSESFRTIRIYCKARCIP
jgi:hypothetical protein